MTPFNVIGIHVTVGNVKLLPITGQSKIDKIKELSLPVHGVKLFNSLPKQVRDITSISVDRFKAALDSFLKQISDEPQIVGYTAYRRADTNSINDMIILINRDPFHFSSGKDISRGLAYDCQSWRAIFENLQKVQKVCIIYTFHSRIAFIYFASETAVVFNPEINSSVYTRNGYEGAISCCSMQI